MGANGSHRSRSTDYFYGRRWKTVSTLSNGVKIIEFKESGTPGKMPEESHTPNSIYAMMNKNGDGIKSIAVYGNDCKKIVEIHTTDHKGLGPHYHTWNKNSRPVYEHSLSTNAKWASLLAETQNCL